VQKLFIKKEKEKEKNKKLRQNRQVSEISKTMGT
jgi:hypothetical protein